MNTSFKNFAIRALTVSTLAVAAMTTANAGVFIYRTRIVAPVVVAPVVAAPVLVAAPVFVAPVYVPTCRLVSVPFVNAYTGVTYLVPRRICN